jgi:nucleoside-diphosphate-sugar epimerase
MLQHLNAGESAPSRVVVLGPSGSVGAPVMRDLVEAGLDVLPVGKARLDLTDASAAAELTRLLRADDVLVFVSAAAPVKNRQQLLDNVLMANAVCEALQSVRPAHVVYISSDAVYADSPEPLIETSPTAPTSLHGVMHLCREMMLQEACRDVLCILRPTLVYGADDRHGGYGPNRFFREARSGGPIQLFGNGEELRDHVAAEDVAAIVRRVVLRRSIGVLNVATGMPATFEQIAIMIASVCGVPDHILRLPRSGPMPHRGFRVFDVAATNEAFADFRFTPLADGLRRLCKGGETS